VRVGGGWQGLERGVRNAWETLVERDVSLRADGGAGAAGRGDGGEVVVWSDGTTRFAGRISARGGWRGGDGGRAEVSGRAHLYMRGLADLRAPRGRAGTLLLDPGRVDLCHEGTTDCDMTATPTPDDTDGPDRFSDAQLATMLGMADVTVATSAASTGDEDIVVASDFDLSWTAANGLTLDAGRDILLDGSINGGAMGTLALNFGRTLDFGSASLTAMTASATGGATGTQTIAGPSGGSTWAVTGAGAGTLTAPAVGTGTQSVAFSRVENLQGGAGVDAFTVSGAHTGDLMGGGGADTFTVSGSLTDSTLVGGDGADVFTVSGSLLRSTLQGRSGADTFVLNPGGSVGVASVIAGGAGADIFDFDGGTVTGAVYGGAGADALDFTTLATAVELTLRGRPDADGFIGAAAGGAAVGVFSDIDEVRGSAAGTDRVTGLGAGGAFQGMATNPTGYAFGGRTLALSGFESTLSGATDVLDLSAQSGGLQVLLSGVATTGSYSGTWSSASLLYTSPSPRD